jgi:hypothetical protein
VRLAWKILGSLVAVPALLFGSVQIASALAHEERTEVVEVDASGLERVEVDNGTGSVRIVGVEDADAVTVTARISDGWRKTGHSVERDGDRLVVEASCPILFSQWCNVRYTIEMPSDLAALVDADNGSVTVTDLAADVEASSDNGRVEVARIEGDVRLDSDNGSVIATDLRTSTIEATSDNGRVSLELVAAPRTVIADSDNGSVEIVLPETDELYRVEASSDNGTVSAPIRQDPDSDRSITATSDNGDVTIAYGLSG